MSFLRPGILSDGDLQALHAAALRLLRETGVRVPHEATLRALGEHGAVVDLARQVAKFPETLVLEGVQRAAKRYLLHGRTFRQMARFGHGDLNLMSSPGQHGWFDLETGQPRPATLEDARAAIRLGDALPNVTIVGALAQPAEWDPRWRDVSLTAELLKGSTKPTRAWVQDARVADYVLEMYRAVAGGADALRQRPMTETFLEPISPLQFPRAGLEVAREYARAGQPVCVGPLAMSSGTAPATLAGTLAQENAEILAGVAIVQVLEPGTPVLYGGIPHILDPRSSVCSFGSPEQALMAVAMVQLGRFYGLPVYVNVGLTDAKTLDVQAGVEKGATLALGALAGADLVGHAGIRGADHGGSLEWLVADDELMAYVQRLRRGFEVSPETLAIDVIAAVGPGGNFLAEDHTLAHYRREFWLPGTAWERRGWTAWEQGGGRSAADHLRARALDLLRQHTPEPLDPALAAELDQIAASARAACAA